MPSQALSMVCVLPKVFQSSMEGCDILFLKIWEKANAFLYCFTNHNNPDTIVQMGKAYMPFILVYNYDTIAHGDCKKGW